MTSGNSCADNLRNTYLFRDPDFYNLLDVMMIQEVYSYIDDSVDIGECPY